MEKKKPDWGGLTIKTLKLCKTIGRGDSVEASVYSVLEVTAVWFVVITPIAKVTLPVQTYMNRTSELLPRCTIIHGMAWQKHTYVIMMSLHIRKLCDPYIIITTIIGVYQ